MTISTTGGVIPTAGTIQGIAITGAPSGAGDMIVATSTTAAAWQTPSLEIRMAAGVPSGAPAFYEVPIAFDSTPVTGGLYGWDGAAWVKVAAIV